MHKVDDSRRRGPTGPEGKLVRQGRGQRWHVEEGVDISPDNKFFQHCREKRKHRDGSIISGSDGSGYLWDRSYSGAFPLKGNMRLVHRLPVEVS